ncbi:MAG: TetR/AcrR family transcriptional regulator [Nocardioides sp.]
MSKSVTKLVPSVGSRRSSHSSTKRRLIAVATDLFTEHGYAAASLDAIVAGAEVTKGALYHHYSGKQALFEAVFINTEAESAESIRKALTGHRDPWQKAQAGLRAFLEVIQDPTYRRVVIQDGPAVLGFERYREQEERSAYAHVVDIVRDVLHAGGADDLDEEMVQTFARIFFGALSSAGETVASAEDPQTAAARVEAAITFILSGFQALAAQEAALEQ